MMACFTTIGILFFLGLLLLIFISFTDDQTRWIPWQKLAEVNKLSFAPSDFFDGARVFGNYGRYYVTLTTFQKGHRNSGQIYTQLTISVTRQVSCTSLTNGGVFDTPLSVDDAVSLLKLVYFDHHNIREQVKTDPMGRRISYETPGIETDIKYLQFLLNWLSDVADAYPAIVTLGGEAVPTLHSLAKQDSRLGPLVTQLLYDIANETKTRLSNRTKDLVCPRCLTSCGEHKIKLSWWQSIAYYGCRTCHQSRKFFEGWVVALLDNQTTQEQIQQNGVLRVNWLARRTLFDFDEVEIIQATDEDVERFAVQVGNDTDPLRKSRYEQKRCVVSADCGLSENSKRILQRMFGLVELERAVISLRHTFDEENGLTHFTADEGRKTTEELRAS